MSKLEQGTLQVFGRVCMFFAAAQAAVLCLLAVVMLVPWVLYAVLIVFGIVNGLIGLGAYLELHRKEEVRGKGMREVP